MTSAMGMPLAVATKQLTYVPSLVFCAMIKIFYAGAEWNMEWLIQHILTYQMKTCHRLLDSFGMITKVLENLWQLVCYVLEATEFHVQGLDQHWSQLTHLALLLDGLVDSQEDVCILLLAQILSGTLVS